MAGFYDDALGPHPADAVAVAPDLHASMGAGQANGMQIGSDPITKQPVLEARPVAALTVQGATLALTTQLRTAETAGVHFTASGSTISYLFPTDDSSILRYNAVWGSIQAGLRKDGLPIIASDGTPVALSNADAGALIAKALAYIEACSTVYQTLFAEIQANPATSITAGWPSNS